MTDGIAILVICIVYTVIVVLEVVYVDKVEKFFAHVDATIDRAVRTLHDHLFD